MNSFKLAVLSDHHIDCDKDAGSWELAERAFKAAVAAGVDHVVVAGDLFDCATAMHRDRGRVEKYLRNLGLWHRDRLTIVVGNHDIFHTPHRSSGLAFALEVARIASLAAQGNYDTFCEWAGALAGEQDRLNGTDDLFPLQKRLGHLLLSGADTTSANTTYAGNGYWRADDDRLLRQASKESNGERRVLAIHHSPTSTPELSIMGLLRGDYPFGFPPGEFHFLKGFASDMRVDSIVCGHVHALEENDEEVFDWVIGDEWRTDVHMVGRTGGVHEATPSFGILTVPARGSLVWKIVEV